MPDQPHDRVEQHKPPPSLENIDELRLMIEKAVRRVCPPWLRHQSEDIVQDVMVRVLRTVQKQDIQTWSYVQKVAFNATLNEIQRVRHRKEYAADAQQIDETRTIATVDPERASSFRSLERAIRECLARIVEARRLAVSLHLFGYGLSESAEILGWPTKRVDNLRYRGMADLRRCLEGKGIAP